MKRLRGRVLAVVGAVVMLVTAALPAAAAVDESPQGDAVVVVGDGGLVQVVGWVFDRSSFGRAVEVTVTVDGVPFGGARADLPSEYLYPYGVAGQHAFWTAIRIAPGSREVCAVFRNVGAGADTEGPCTRVDVAARASADSPQGDVSVLVNNDSSQLVVMGWVFDHSSLYSALDVDIVVDGTVTGRWRADGASPYLAPYGVPGSHSFFGGVGVSSGDHRVCVVARDIAPGGDDVVGCRDVTVAAVVHSPEADVQISMNANGSVNLKGWVIDRSDLGSSVRVAVFQNGTLTASPQADASSPQLAPYGLGNRGLDLRLPPVTRSEQVSVCALALNIGTGENRWIACADIDPRGTTAVADQTSASSLTVLVNKKTPLSPLRYAPALWPLSAVGVGGGQTMRPEAAVAMRDLVQAAAASGHSLNVASGYRSYGTQVAVFNRYVSERGVAGAELTSARPGYSEHQTGLVADVVAVGSGCGIDQCFGSLPAGQWVAANAWRYGFIVRYPNGYTSVTGYEWEPWHVRYVGADAAREMHDGGIPTYEQYLGAPAASTY